MTRWAFAAAWLLASCVRDSRPPPSDDLNALTVGLAPGPIRLLTQGLVGSKGAEVFFDVSSPLSTVTGGCFQAGPGVEGQVAITFPDGSQRQLPEVVLDGLSFGGHRYPPLKVGLEEGKNCEVVMGIDLLLPWALKVDLPRRQLTFLRSATKLDYQQQALRLAGDEWETHQLDLTRHPAGDWPMIPLRAIQADQVMVAPLVFSTREAITRVSSSAVRASGLKIGKELFDGLAVPPGVHLPLSTVVAEVVATDHLELSPGFGVSSHSLRLDQKWQGPGAAGVLGSDLWGRFDSVIDVQAGVLWLKRPRVIQSGSVERCVRGAATGEEGCYELFARRTSEGLEAAVTLWRSQPLGGRLHLEVKTPTQPTCRIGLSFGAADRGASAHFVFPWSRLRESMPECAAALANATGAHFSLYEEGPLSQCPGTCAFAEDLLTRRISCACNASGELSETDRALLRLYKTLLEQEIKNRNRALEPTDP